MSLGGIEYRLMREKNNWNNFSMRLQHNKKITKKGRGSEYYYYYNFFFFNLSILDSPHTPRPWRPQLGSSDPERHTPFSSRTHSPLCRDSGRPCWALPPPSGVASQLCHSIRAGQTPPSAGPGFKTTTRRAATTANWNRRLGRLRHRGSFSWMRWRCHGNARQWRDPWTASIPRTQDVKVCVE